MPVSPLPSGAAARLLLTTDARVEAGAAVDRIGARTAVHRVVAVATAHGVVAVPAFQDVSPRVALQPVVPGATDQVVVARPTDQLVRVPVAGERIIERRSSDVLDIEDGIPAPADGRVWPEIHTYRAGRGGEVQLVDARSAAQDVVSGASAERVVVAARWHDVGAAPTVQPVTSRS